MTGRMRMKLNFILQYAGRGGGFKEKIASIFHRRKIREFNTGDKIRKERVLPKSRLKREV